MKDFFGRKINYMRISITDLCNLRCVYCMPEEGIEKYEHSKNLSFEEIIDIVKAGITLGVDKIRLTGGEPLVRRGIVNLVHDIASIKGIKDLAMTTNGILLPIYAQYLKDAGLNRVNISLDTFDPEKFHKITRKGQIEDVFLGIEAAKKAGFSPIKINTVLIKGFNDDEIEKFVNYTIDNAVEVRFIELMPLGQSADYSEGQYISNDTILEKNPLLKHFEKNNGMSHVKYYKLKDAKGCVGLINSISNNFCKGCNRIRLTADGKIKPCLHSDFEIDVVALKKKGFSYEEIIKKAIDEKPERHYIDDDKKQVLRNMNEIGG